MFANHKGSNEPAGSHRASEQDAVVQPVAKNQTVEQKPYTVGEFAKLTGVSIRTLHHYDAYGLLHPQRQANGYRTYGPAEVDRMQEILLYRELGMGLADIRQILDSPGFDRRHALAKHLQGLQARRDRLDKVIASVQRSLDEMDGGAPMDANEKFDAFKKNLIQENEAKYGAEVRERWGDEAADDSNARVMSMGQDEFQHAAELEATVKREVLAGLSDGDSDGAHARAAAQAHADWLRVYWPEGNYSPEAHASLAQMYLDDQRFRAYYEAWAPGAAEFFVHAIQKSGM